MLSRRTFLQTTGAGAFAIRLVGVPESARPSSTLAQAQVGQKPNLLFMLVDNLGYGELGVYGGGATRGAPTPRIDTLASEGLRLTNMNMEAQCTPSRSSILTGRFAIRSGTHSVPFGGVADGLTQWEVTMAESLSAAGYATALNGKWHLGSQNCRLPNDQGFDEWYGIPRTTDEALWPGSPGYSPAVMPPEQIMEGRKGEKSRDVKVYDVEQRRLIDAEITRAPSRSWSVRRRRRSPSLPMPPSRNHICRRCPILHSPGRPATAIGRTCSRRWMPTLDRCSTPWTAWGFATTRS
jgi:arylsulfatase